MCLALKVGSVGHMLLAPDFVMLTSPTLYYVEHFFFKGKRLYYEAHRNVSPARFAVQNNTT